MGEGGRCGHILSTEEGISLCDCAGLASSQVNLWPWPPHDFLVGGRTTLRTCKEVSVMNDDGILGPGFMFTYHT